LNWWRLVAGAILALVAGGILRNPLASNPLLSILFKIPVVVFVLALITQFILPTLLTIAKERLDKMLKSVL
jgi:hypothetical protein